MPIIVCALSIPPDKADAWEAAATDLKSDQHPDARRRLGISRELVSLQRLPVGDVAVVYIELALDPGQILMRMQSSDSPFYCWLAQEAPQALGITPPQSPPRPLLEWPAR